jgi:hypothetical protein
MQSRVGRQRLGAAICVVGIGVLVAACGRSTPVASGAGLPGASTPGIDLASVPVPGAPTPADPGVRATGWGGLDQLPCSTRVSQTAIVAVRKATAFDDTWTTYGNSAAGWTGGDSVHAYALGPDQVLWTYADSFLGPIGPHGTRSPAAPLYHNIFVVQRGDQFQTVVGGVPGKLGSLVITSDPYQIFLALASLQTTDRLQEFLLEDVIPPHQVLRQVPQGTLLVTYALPSLRRLSVVRLEQETASVQWGAAVTTWGADTYIYGASATGDDKSLYVARVAGTDLAQAWQYWDGHGWSLRASAAAAIAHGVSAELSVTDANGMAVLVTSPTGVPYSPFIRFATACSPLGPFHTIGTIRASYSVGPVGEPRFGVDDSYVYDAMDQPAFNAGSTWLISFDRNVLRYSDLAKNVDVYRPSYLWVQLGPVSEAVPGSRSAG